MSDEKILTGDLSGVYDQLTTSIIKRARATAATNILVKNAETQLSLEAQLLAINQKVVKFSSQIFNLTHSIYHCISTCWTIE